MKKEGKREREIDGGEAEIRLDGWKNGGTRKRAASCIGEGRQNVAGERFYMAVAT